MHILHSVTSVDGLSASDQLSTFIDVVSWLTYLLTGVIKTTFYSM